jgi:hypothetical protein
LLSRGMSSCPFEQGPMRAEILQLGALDAFEYYEISGGKKRIITSQNCLISSISTVQVATLCLAENRGVRLGAALCDAMRCTGLGLTHVKTAKLGSFQHQSNVLQQLLALAQQFFNWTLCKDPTCFQSQSVSKPSAKKRTSRSHSTLFKFLPY